MVHVKKTAEEKNIKSIYLLTDSVIKKIKTNIASVTNIRRLRTCNFYKISRIQNTPDIL